MSDEPENDTTEEEKPEPEPKLYPNLTRGTRTPAHEIEERIRIIENLIVAGKASTYEEVIYGLTAAGHAPDVGYQTVKHYVKEARKRLSAADADVKKARQEVVIRSLLSDASSIKRKLVENNVLPRWGDHIRVFELLGKFLGVGEPLPEALPMPELPDDHDDFEDLDEAELGKLLAEMLERHGEALDLPSPETIEKSLKGEE